MSDKILISACLLGQPVRYDGRGMAIESEILRQWERDERLVVVCPEVMGGLPTPRPPAEIEPGFTAETVIAGEGAILDPEGGDVTQEFLRGARLAVEMAREAGCKYALLTDKSPSCGSTLVYDGTHEGNRIPGVGVTTALLKADGVEVYAQHQIQDLAARLAQ